MKIDFEFDTEYGVFRDSLEFPDDQPLPSDADIEAMEIKRRDDWVAYMKEATEALSGV